MGCLEWGPRTLHICGAQGRPLNMRARNEGVPGEEHGQSGGPQGRCPSPCPRSPPGTQVPGSPSSCPAGLNGHSLKLTQSLSCGLRPEGLPGGSVGSPREGCGVLCWVTVLGGTVSFCPKFLC